MGVDKWKNVSILICNILNFNQYHFFKAKQNFVFLSVCRSVRIHNNNICSLNYQMMFKVTN